MTTDFVKENILRLAGLAPRPADSMAKLIFGIFYKIWVMHDRDHDKTRVAVRSYLELKVMEIGMEDKGVRLTGRTALGAPYKKMMSGLDHQLDLDKYTSVSQVAVRCADLNSGNI